MTYTIQPKKDCIHFEVCEVMGHQCTNTKGDPCTYYDKKKKQKYLHPEKCREFGLTVGLCGCVQENNGIPDKRCKYCYGSGIFVYTNVDVPTPSNCPHWVKDDIRVKGFRCALYRDTISSNIDSYDNRAPRCSANHHNDDGSLIVYLGEAKPCSGCAARQRCFGDFMKYRESLCKGGKK